MQKENLIAIDLFCEKHEIEISFISSLQQNVLIEITTIKETNFINTEQLQYLEKLIRFHYEMNINIEGIETISYMLQRYLVMQDEIISLRNRLRLYETNE
jgi:chaperone modulatory protein CbpM